MIFVIFLLNQLGSFYLFIFWLKMFYFLNLFFYYKRSKVTNKGLSLKKKEFLNAFGDSGYMDYLYLLSCLVLFKFVFNLSTYVFTSLNFFSYFFLYFNSFRNKYSFIPGWYGIFLFNFVFLFKFFFLVVLYLILFLLLNVSSSCFTFKCFIVYGKFNVKVVFIFFGFCY